MVKTMQALRYALILVVAALTFSPLGVQAAPTVTDAWIPEAPPMSAVMAGFMTLHNPDENDVTIVSVQSEQFEEVQMHLSITENGIAKMLPQKY